MQRNFEKVAKIMSHVVVAIYDHNYADKLPLYSLVTL